MFKKLIEKQKLKKVEKIINEPRFTIKDLYVADIVLLKDRESDNGRIHSSYREVKKSVIVEKIDGKKYTHIKSQQVLNDAYWAYINDYAVVNIKKFKEKLAIFMKKKHLTPESKLSIKQVIQIEDALQCGFFDELTADEIFK